MIYSSIEPLEPRIAPASATAFFTDQDGDDVTIKVTTRGGSSAELKAKLESAQSLAIAGVGLQLQTLDLSDAIFRGANVSITAKPGDSGGDGLVAVGTIAANGQRLGKVVVDGDVRAILVGTDENSTAIKSLTVRSMGIYGALTQEIDSRFSLFTGSVGKLMVKENVEGVVIDHFGSSIANLTIGGSLIGGTEEKGGFITSFGKIGKVRIGGNLEAGSGEESGKLRVIGNVSSLTIGGSLFGGNDGFDDGLGQINIGGNVGTLLIGGSVVGRDDGYIACQVSIGGDVAKLQVRGSVIGGIDDTEAGSGIRSGSISVVGKARSIRIDGDIIGSSTVASGTLILQEADRIFVGGDIRGGGLNTGYIALSDGVVGSIAVQGSIIGGDDGFSGGILGSLTTVQRLTIGGNLESRGNAASQGTIELNSIGSLAIGGDIISSPVPASATKQIDVSGSLGTVAIGGEIRGSEANTVVIQAETLTSLVVNKAARYAEIAVTDTDARVKNLQVNGAWIASRFTIANDDGADNIFGTNDDPLPPVDALGSIAKIVIKGQALGTAGGDDSFLIRAPWIGSLSIAGTKYGFANGAQSFAVGITNDLIAVDTK